MPGGARGVEAPAADAAVGDRLKTLLLQVLLLCLLARCCCSVKQNQENNLPSAPGHKPGVKLQIPRLYPSLSEHAQRLLGLLESRYKSKSNPTQPLVDSNVEVLKDVPSVPQPKDHTGVGEIITSDIIEGRPAPERVNSELGNIIRTNQLTKENINKIENTIKEDGHNKLEHADEGHNENNNFKAESIGDSEIINSLDSSVNSEFKHKQVNGEKNNKQDAEVPTRSDTASTDGGKGLPVVVLSDGLKQENLNKNEKYEKPDSINRTSNENEAEDDHFVNPATVIRTDSVKQVKQRTPLDHDAESTPKTTHSTKETNTQSHKTTEANKLESQESLQQQKPDAHKPEPQRFNHVGTNDHKHNDKPQGRIERNKDQEGEKNTENEEKEHDTREKTEKVVSDVLQKHNEKKSAKKEETRGNNENSENGKISIETKTNDNEEDKKIILMERNVDDSHNDFAEEYKEEIKKNYQNDYAAEDLPENEDKENSKEDIRKGSINVNVNMIDKKVKENTPVKDKFKEKEEKREPIDIEDKEKVIEFKIQKENDLVTNDNQNIISEGKDDEIISKNDIKVEKVNILDANRKQEVETSYESKKDNVEKEKDKSRDEKEKDFIEAMKEDHSEKSKEEAEMKQSKSGKTEEPGKTEEKPAKAEEKTAKAEEKTREAEEKTTKTEEKPAEAEEKPAEADEIPAETDEKATEAEEQPAKAEEQPAKAEEQPAKAEEQPAKAEEQPAKAEEQPAKAEEQPTKTEEQPTKTEEQPTKTVEQPAKAEKEPTKKVDELVKKEDELVKKEDELVKKEDELVKKGEPVKKEDTVKNEEVLETYEEFQRRVNAAKEKKPDNGQPKNGHPSKVQRKNYASPDCGAKMISANPEAQHASKVIASNRDEYLLNKCIDKTWFIVELCESIHPQRFDLANFELFSNLPKDIVVYGSHRFPTRDWTMLGRFLGLEGNRGIQSFNIDMEGFYKYIKVDVLSHYGSEFFCPISHFLIYGLSEFEVIEDTGEGTDEQEDTYYHSEPKKKDVDKQLVFPFINDIVNKMMEVIKRGYRPALGSGEPIDACQSLSPNSEIKPESCVIAEHINYIMQCYSAEYQDLMQRPLIASAVSNTPLCKQLVSVMCATPHIKDSLVYDTACNNSYVCVMLSPKHVLAMCFMQDPSLLTNTGYSAAQLGCSDSSTPTDMGCSDNSPDNVSAKSIPALRPREGDVGSGGPPPLMVNNPLINTSTVTRTDDPESQNNGSYLSTDPVTALPVDDTIQSTKLIDEIDPEKKKESEIEESGHQDPASSGSNTQEKESKKKPKKQPKEEQKVQDDVTKTKDDKQQGNGHGSVNMGGDIKVADVPLTEEITLTTPTPVEPQIPEPKVPQTPTNKESVMVRLSNKIKVLEANVTISNAYLEELSRQYKTRMENMDQAFKTNAQVAYERDEQHQKDISELKDQLKVVTGIVMELQSEKASLANTVVEQHLLLMLLEVLVLTLVFTWCNRRRRVPETNPVNSGDVTNMQMTKEQTSRTEVNSNWPPQYYKCGHNRRNSLDSVMGEREVRPRRQRRLSEDGLNITGTYSDLLIIEPAIPIMMDSHHSERKKKRKNGSLKRSKSNSNIRRGEKYSPNPRRVVKDKAERVSSAGVLFVGDKQVSATGDVTQTQPQGNELTNHTLNNSTLDTSLDDSKLSQDYTNRSFVDEIDGGVGLGCESGGQGKDHIECCVNCDELSKSRALSLTKSLSFNGKEKVKKGKKMKRSKSINKNDNKDNVYNEHSYATTNGSSVSFGYESNLPFGGYCYDSRDLADYPQYTDAAAHLNGHNSYDYYNGYYSNSRTDADNLVTSWVSNNLSYDPLLPSLNGQRGYEDLSPTTRLRSDNWEWYAGSGQSTEITENISGSAGRGPLGSCSSNETVSETISTCSSDSSGKNQRGKSQEKKTRSGKKKKSKSHKNPNVVEEEVGEVT